MAIAFNVLADDPDGADATSYATPSFTPGASRGIIVAVHNSKASAPDTPTLDTPAWLDGAWTQEASIPNAASNHRLTVFSGKAVASPSAAAATADFGGLTQTGCTIQVIELTEPAADFVLQPTTDAPVGNFTDRTTTLPGALAAATSQVLGIFGINSNSAVSVAGAETQLTDNGHTLPNRRLHIQHKLNDTSSSVTFVSSTVVAVVLEIVQAAGLTVSVGQVVETEVAQAITPLRIKSLGAEIISTEEVQVVQPLRIVPVGQVVETEIVNAISPAGIAKIAAAGGVWLFGDEDGTAQSVGQVIETEIVNAIVPLGKVAVSQVVETEVVNAIATARSMPIGQIVETEVVNAMVPLRVVPVGQVIETEVVNAVFPPSAGVGAWKSMLGVGG